MGDLLAILPMMDDLILLDVSGKMIYEALENGVSMWPKLEGRFPQVSGITFAFDPKKPAGSRVDPEFVKVGDEYLDMEQRYKLVTKAYLEQGKDGRKASIHHQSLVTLSRKTSVVKQLESDGF